MKKYLFIFLLVNVAFLNSFCQKKPQPLRVEIEAKYASDDYYVKPVGKQGVVLFNRNQKNNSLMFYNWTFTLYNSDFKEVAEDQVEIPRKMIMFKNYYDSISNNLFFLFSEGFNGSLSNSWDILDKNYIILKYDVSSTKISKITGRLDKPILCNDFKAYNNVVYWGGNTYGKPRTGCESSLYICLPILCIDVMTKVTPEPVLYVSDFNTDQTKKIPFSFEGRAQISNLYLDQDGKLNAFITNIPDNENFNAYTCTFEDNAISSKIKIKRQKNDRMLLEGKMVSFGENEKIIVGKYRIGKFKTKVRKRGVEKIYPPDGIYICKMNGEEQDFIKYIKYTDFKSVFKEFNKRTQNKIERRKAKGKSLAFFELLVHDIIPRGDEFFCLGEAYYPEYHTECYYTDKGTRCYTVFDGYRYVGAVAFVLDKDGEMVWDEYFPINDILSYYLKERVKVFVGDNGDITLLYNYNGSIKSRTITGRNSTEREITKIQTNFSNDKVKGVAFSDMDFWYDNYFIAYGFQKIKNSEQKGKKKRTVFYFNKIEINQ